MNHHHVRTMWNLSMAASIAAGLIGWLPIFTGTIIPFCMDCFQVITLLVCTLISVRVWKQQRSYEGETVPQFSGTSPEYSQSPTRQL